MFEEGNKGREITRKREKRRKKKKTTKNPRMATIFSHIFGRRTCGEQLGRV
jgi:hypothetical protein